MDLPELIQEAKHVYESQGALRCPFFGASVILNSDGFNHLLYKPNRMPRNVEEQKIKLRLLKKGLRIIQKAGTVQEYRIRIEKFGKPARDGFTKTKKVEYWAFHDIVGENKRFLMRVIVRRIGDGAYHFWSVMPHGKIHKQRLYQQGIEDV
jgi:ribosomal protein L28